MQCFVKRLQMILVASWILGALALPFNAHARVEPYGSQAFVRISNNRPAIEVFVNGQGPFLFVIDTATSNTVLTHALLEKLRLEPLPGPPVEVVTAAGKVRSQIYLIAETATCGVIVEGVRAVVMDLPTNADVMGALGADFLSNFTVDLDFRARKLTLYPEKTEVLAPGMRRIVGVSNSHGFVVVPAMVENVLSSAIFDTGALFSVANVRLGVSTNRIGRLTARKVETSVTDAVHQREPAESFNFSKISIGPASWLNVRVLIADMRAFELIDLNRRPAIFVGMDMIDGHRIIIDYSSGSVFIGQ